jgi:mandelate racemase/muconate lactonizing enzyme-like protein
MAPLIARRARIASLKCSSPMDQTRPVGDAGGAAAPRSRSNHFNGSQSGPAFREITIPLKADRRLKGARAAILLRLVFREAADIVGACAAMERRMHGNRGAKAAIEIALHDHVGRATATPAAAWRRSLRRRGSASILRCT